MLKVNQFYCVACRKRVTLKDSAICVKVYSNKKTGSTPALRGKCSCGTNVTKFIARDKADAMIKKFGKCKGKNASLARSRKPTKKSRSAKPKRKSPGRRPAKSGKKKSGKKGKKKGSRKK